MIYVGAGFGVAFAVLITPLLRCLYDVNRAVRHHDR